jgi:hypothetical protein
MHLTLKFGDTPADRLEALAPPCKRPCNGSTVPAIIEGSGVFPKEDYPRVLWVGVNEQTGALLRLAKALDSVHSFGFAKRSAFRAAFDDRQSQRHTHPGSCARAARKTVCRHAGDISRDYLHEK